MVRVPVLVYAFSLVAGALTQSVTVHDGAHNVTYVGAAAQGVEQFQNIRYGQNTGGAHRFKPPQPFAYASGTTVQATAAGPSCPQNTQQNFFGFTQNEGVYNMSEDCLNLRIARPAGTRPDAKLPVMVWIYGGGDETGSTNYTLYDPTALVAGAAAKGTPVVFAAMNYRVNVFGFANSPALRAEQSLNAGLLDQRLALEWLREHVAVFGGDPNRTTIFGQSDGGTGVGLQMTAYGGNGSVPFQRAILQSGSPAGDPGVSGNLTVNATSLVANLAGCTGTNATSVLACLRGLDMSTLLSAVLRFENLTANITSQDIFYPAVDGAFVPAAPSALMRTGQFHKNVSVIAGFTYNDGSIFTPWELSGPAKVQAFVHASYPFFNQSTRDTLISMYPVTAFAATAANMTISPYFLQAAQIYRDVNFACPAIDVAHRVAQYGSPSYLYLLNATSFDGLLLLAKASFEGVIHISDVPFVFNNANIGLGITPAQQMIQTAMSGSWAHFVVTGDPVGNASTLTQWPKAFNQTQAAVKSAAVSQATVRVIGGPQAGPLTLGSTSTSGGEPEHDLLQKCAYINSAAFYQQLET